MFLERVGEVLGVFEAEEVGGLGDGLVVAQVGGGFLHHEVADDGGGSLASGLTDEVAEVVICKQSDQRSSGVRGTVPGHSSGRWAGRVCVGGHRCNSGAAGR